MIQKYATRTKSALYFFLAIIISVVILCSFILQGRVSSSEPVTKLSDNWTISYNGQTFTNVSLAHANIPIANTGSTFTLSCKLPATEVSSACLQIHTIHSMIQVYIDNKCIYTFGKTSYQNKDMLPMCYLYVPLSEGYAGKNLRIVYTAGQNAAFAGFDSIFLGNRNDLQLLYTSRIHLALYLGIFLCILAILLFATTPFLMVYRPNDLRIFFGALISLDLGTYILSINNVFNLFSNHLLLNTTLEYGSLYLIPSLIAAYLVSITHHNRFRHLYQLLFVINFAFFISTIAAHLTGAALFSRHTSTIHILCVIEGPIAIFLIFKSLLYKKRKTDDPDAISSAMLLIGLVLFLVCAIIEIAIFNILKFFSDQGEVSDRHMIITFGALLFVMCLVISYFMYQIYSMESENRQKLLRGLAYFDPLTKLSNRAKCQEELLQLGNSDQPYVIISIDLDYLKRINDTYGHMEGDRFLIGFAEKLQASFRECDLVGRMGGDEFLVLLYDDSPNQATERIQSLQNRLSKQTIGSYSLPYSFSYGIASDSELPGQSAEDVYMMADNRMYEMKRLRHLNTSKELEGFTHD